MGALALLVLAAVALGVAVTSASPQGRPRWTYDTNNRYNGPGRWPGICDQHRSARQSPIDISLTGHKVRRVRPFQMDGFEDPANAIIDTSGTTVNVSLAQNEKKRKVQMDFVLDCTESDMRNMLTALRRRLEGRVRVQPGPLPLGRL